MSSVSDIQDEWKRDLKAVLDPGAVSKHGVLVAARREIERLRREVDEWQAVAIAHAGRADRGASRLAELRSHP